MTDAEIQYMRQVICDAKSSELLPTTALQLESLNRFMTLLGYEPVGVGGQSFVLKDKTLPYPIQLSSKLAVILHNYGVFIKGCNRYEVAKPMRSYKASSAVFVSEEVWKIKIVESVSLQWSKKKKAWVTASKRVKFVNPEEPCKKDVST